MLPSRRQKRTTFAPETLKRLNDEFEAQPSPNAFHMRELAKELGLDFKNVRVWFCNRRQNWKQQRIQQEEQRLEAKTREQS